jgi:site-specific DNA-methyltransferase (adenine-specific)
VNTAVLFSSAKDDWRTPPELFTELNAEFCFCVDVAASFENSLCPAFFSEALTRGWRIGNHRGAWTCWCNPPYSRGLQGKFIAKAASEREKGVTTVMLLPARTDTKAFHAHIYDAEKWQPREGVEVRFLPGRIKFVGAKHGAPFPSMIVVFRGAKP